MNESSHPTFFDDQNGSTENPANESKSSLDTEIELVGDVWQEDPAYEGAVGRTMFDLPSSKDNLISVLVPMKDLRNVSSQALVRIRSRSDGDGRTYIGIVVEGPFNIPNGLRADSQPLVLTTVYGATFMPPYHGRVAVEIIAEIVDERRVPPRFRPLPNSPVEVLGVEETRAALTVEGDVTLGMAIGRDNIEVNIPSDKKHVLPRHLGVMGTTGSGKSTTVSGQVAQYQAAGMATILIDTEGEYTHINEPTDEENMIAALKRRGKQPEGVDQTYVYHLHGRDTTNLQHPKRSTFTLQFDRLSPYAVMEILELNEAQQQRYLKAYDLAKGLLLKLKIFPTTPAEHQELMDLDEMERGFPSLILAMMYDVVRGCASEVAKELTDEDGTLTFTLRAGAFKAKSKEFIQAIKAVSGTLPKHIWSWRIVQGRLGQLLRLKMFDNRNAQPLHYDALTTPGRVSIIDLSDTDSPQISNLVIADLLRGVMEYQNESYRKMQKIGGGLRRVMVVIEEAHEFLSRERIKQMPALKEQVERIARRGRKRWLGLVFVTQSPQHLPDEVLGLINSYILHKISDANVISRLKRSIGGIDKGLWRRLPNLAAGQAIVSTPSLARPLLVAIDPTPCKLLMID